MNMAAVVARLEKGQSSSKDVEIMFYRMRVSEFIERESKCESIDHENIYY